MNGNVFECFEEQTDRRQYARTLEALKAYVKKELKYSADIKPLFGETMAAPTIEMPLDPGEGSNKIEDMIYIEEVKKYVKRTRELKNNLAIIHTVAWGQCSVALRERVKSLNNYMDRTDDNNCCWLLKQIKAVTSLFNEKRNVFMSLIDAMISLMTCKQAQNQSVGRTPTSPEAGHRPSSGNPNLCCAKIYLPKLYRFICILFTDF
jgi:hypothetical protein